MNMDEINGREAMMGAVVRKLETITNARGEKHATIPTGGIEYHWAIIGMELYECTNSQPIKSLHFISISTTLTTLKVKLTFLNIPLLLSSHTNRFSLCDLCGLLYVSIVNIVFR